MLSRCIYGIGGSSEAQHLSADILCYLHLMNLPLLQHPQLFQDQGNA